MLEADQLSYSFQAKYLDIGDAVEPHSSETLRDIMPLMLTSDERPLIEALRGTDLFPKGAEVVALPSRGSA